MLKYLLMSKLENSEITKNDLINCISNNLTYTLIATEEKISDNVMNYILKNILNNPLKLDLVNNENYKKENMNDKGYTISIGTNIINIIYVQRKNNKGQAFPDINIYLKYDNLKKIDCILCNQPDIAIEVTKNDSGDAGNMVYQRYIKLLKFSDNVSKYIIYDITKINTSLNAQYVKIAMLFAYMFNIKIIFMRTKKQKNKYITEIQKNNSINLEEYSKSEKLKIIEYCINSTKMCGGTNNRLYRPINLVSNESNESNESKSEVSIRNRTLARTCPNFKEYTSLIISKQEQDFILKKINDKKVIKNELIQICKNFNSKYNANINISSMSKDKLKQHILYYYDLIPENLDNRKEDRYIIECNLLHSSTQNTIHDPNSGFITSLITIIKKIDPESKFIIQKHHLKEKHLKSGAKLLTTLYNYLNNGDIIFENFENFKFDIKPINEEYCKISNSEKNSTIYLEELLNEQGWNTMFSNHAGGEKSNILNIKTGRFYQSDKYTKHKQNNNIKSSRTQGIPDLIVYKDNTIIVIEGKRNNSTDLKNINQQLLLEINWFNQNIKQKQKLENYSIHYGISTFDGTIKTLENNPNTILNNRNLLMFSIFKDCSEKWWINDYKELPTEQQITKYNDNANDNANVNNNVNGNVNGIEN